MLSIHAQNLHVAPGSFVGKVIRLSVAEAAKPPRCHPAVPAVGFRRGAEGDGDKVVCGFSSSEVEIKLQCTLSIFLPNSLTSLSFLICCWESDLIFFQEGVTPWWGALLGERLRSRGSNSVLMVNPSGKHFTTGRFYICAFSNILLSYSAAYSYLTLILEVVLLHHMHAMSFQVFGRGKNQKKKTTSHFNFLLALNESHSLG